MHVSKILHRPGDRQKQHRNLSQSYSLPIMWVLPLQHGRFVYFGPVGSHTQLSAGRAAKCAMVIWVARSVTWRRRRKEVQTSQSDAVKHMFLNIPSQAESCDTSSYWRRLFGLATDVKRSVLKLCERFAIGEVAVRTNLTVCAVFSCVQATVWLPMLGILNVRTDVNACDCTRGLYGHRKSLHWKLTLGEKNPLPHRRIEPASVKYRSDALPTGLHTF